MTWTERIKIAIQKGRFNFQKQDRTYYGVEIHILPLFCSYGQIGYKIYFQGGEIIYDYEFKTTKINNYGTENTNDHTH